MEDGRAHSTDSLARLVLTLVRVAQILRRLDCEVGLRDMRRVVDCQANGDDELDDYDVVEGQVPVKDESHEEIVDQEHRHDDEEGDWQARSDEDDHEKDCNQ